MLPRRGFRLLLALPILAIQNLGCGKVEAGEGTVEIRLSFWGKVQEAQVWEELAELFHRKQESTPPEVGGPGGRPELFGTVTPTHPSTQPPTHSRPRIRIKLEHIAGWNYHAKVLAMTLGKSAPDVLCADDEQFRQLAGNGLYEDLTPYVQRDLKDLAHGIYPVFWNSFRIDDRQYSIPYVGNALLIFYNRDHRRAAGLSPDPNPDWDWEEFNRDAKALTRDLDGDGRTDQFGLNRLSWFYCLQWVWGSGGSDMDPEMSRYTFDTQEAIRGLKFHYDQMHKLKVVPLLGDLPNMNWEAQFLTGRTSMVVTGSWWLLQARQTKGIDWDVAPMPRGPVKRATRATAEGLSISPQSEHKEEAWEWIKFCLSDEAQAILGRSGRGIPARRDMAWKSFPRADSPQREELFLEAMDKYSHRSSLPETWMATEQQIFNPEWDRVVAGEITIEEWVRNTQPRAHKMMSEKFP